MPQREIESRAERDDTDASLRAERLKTDGELARARNSVEARADEVVAVARDLADETLQAARDLADHTLAAGGAAPAAIRDVQRERTAADRSVVEQRALAQERLHAEREDQRRALSALLRLEREATDDGLHIERTRADEVVATRDEFLAMVSHDLRNMLGTVAMSAGMLAKRGTGGDEGERAATLGYAERIQRCTARMNRLVGDLVDVVSLEAGKLRMTAAANDAVEVVKEAADAFQAPFAAKEITLSTEIAAPSLRGHFDHERILQVLANLLSNALKFTERGGKVTLLVVKTGADLCFSVIDTGVGIPANQTTAIFERFQQVTRDRRGLGLGLYISKCIIEAHGGSIRAQRQEAGGTAFHFTLPSAGSATA